MSRDFSVLLSQLGSAAAEEEVSAVEWLRFIQQLLLLLLAARTAGTGHLGDQNTNYKYNCVPNVVNVR